MLRAQDSYCHGQPNQFDNNHYNRSHKLYYISTYCVCKHSSILYFLRVYNAPASEPHR